MMKSKPFFYLTILNLLLVFVSGIQAQSREEVREEFHQTYPLSADGRVSLENINGAVRVAAWDRNEVRVDAVKRAWRQERLAEARIVVNASPDNIQISTEYPHRSTTWHGGTDERRYENPATVEYTLTVPRRARLDSIALINGNLDISGVAGEVRASSINGRVTARGLASEAKLSTINGRLEAFMDRLGDQDITLDSVNGSVALTLPSDANALLRANVVHGNITNDFNLPVRRGRYVGRDLAGQLGQGGARIKLNNVNGSIAIRRAADNRPLNPSTNLLPQTSGGNRDVDVDVDIDVDVDVDVDVDDRRRDKEGEAQRRAREAQRIQMEAQRARRDAERIARDAQREVERATRVLRDQVVGEERTRRDARLIEREQETFKVSGVPNLRAQTFDGSISVRAWDRSEVGVIVSKRAADQNEMRGVNVRIEQGGDGISVVAEFDKTYATRVAPGVTTSNAGADIEINVPRRSNVTATTGDGRIFTEGVTGELNLRTGDGSLQVQGGGGRLQAGTGDGQVRVISFDGAADVRTGDGSVALDGRFTSLSARTGDGAISLALPQNTNATIETHAESVLNEGLAVAEDGDAEKRVRRWRVGGGGALFTLRTGDGHIILRRRNNAQ